MDGKSCVNRLQDGGEAAVQAAFLFAATYGNQRRRPIRFDTLPGLLLQAPEALVGVISPRVPLAPKKRPR